MVREGTRETTASTSRSRTSFRQAEVDDHVAEEDEGESGRAWSAFEANDYAGNRFPLRQGGYRVSAKYAASDLSKEVDIDPSEGRRQLRVRQDFVDEPIVKPLYPGPPVYPIEQRRGLSRAESRARRPAPRHPAVPLLQLPFPVASSNAIIHVLSSPREGQHSQTVAAAPDVPVRKMNGFLKLFVISASPCPCQS